MEKEIFKIEDKVFHFLYGWGTIQKIEDNMIDIDFNGQKVYAFSDNNLLSFTEYTLEGFSQERPIVLPEVGELCLVRDSDRETWMAVQFKKYDKTKPLQFIDSDNNEWNQLKRIKILD
jgi:hypothetical protein